MDVPRESPKFQRISRSIGRLAPVAIAEIRFKFSVVKKEDAPRALAKPEKEPKMKTMWQQGTKTGNWSATIRGIRTVIRVDENGYPTALQFFVNGRLDESAPLSCTIDVAKRIAITIVDRLIEETPRWQAAANKHDRDSFLKR